jgi:hypothetical protein
MGQVKILKMILAEPPKDYLRKNWLKLKKCIRNTVIFYKRRKSLLILDIMTYSLILGVVALLFLVGPSLDTEGMKISGMTIITLIVVGVHIYSGARKRLLSRSQRKLSHWLKQNLNNF